jgi:hypothetical protein
LLELGDGEGDISIQQVEGQISARHKKKHISNIKYTRTISIQQKGWEE